MTNIFWKCIGKYMGSKLRTHTPPPPKKKKSNKRRKKPPGWVKQGKEYDVTHLNLMIK